MPPIELYERREQSFAKHEVLSKYLERFAHKIGSHWNSITYIDGFSGPWNSVSQDLKDSSFAIAISQLRAARETLRQRGRSIRLRCFFVEKDQKAFAALESYRAQQADIEIQTLNATFEDSIGQIVSFVKNDRGTFAFTFIDPTGWTGFPLEKIGPLISHVPGEVLINFMTSHIIRWIEDDAVRHQLAKTFGSYYALDRIKGLHGLDRFDACVAEYCAAIKATGNFTYASPAVILQPTKEWPHFHLIYATRKDEGLHVFKEAERHAMNSMEKSRASAEQREKRPLFDSSDMPQSKFYDDLRDRYLSRSKTELETLLRMSGRVLYDDAWAACLSRPLVWESDLKEWIKSWRKTGAISLEGLGPEDKVPKRARSHFLTWQLAEKK